MLSKAANHFYVLHNIAVALNFERLYKYNKTSDLGIDYEKGCQIFTDFDKCTLYKASKYIAKMKTVKCAAFLKSMICKNTRAYNSKCIC